VRVSEIRVGGLGLANLDRHQIVEYVFQSLDGGKGGWVITLNTDLLLQCTRDPELRAQYERAELRVADGLPLMWAAWLQGTPLPDRVAGSDLVWLLAEAAARTGRSLYLLGGDSGVADGAAARLRAELPNLRIVGYSSPRISGRPTAQEVDHVRETLLAARPDLVYVALGAPKQEWLIASLRDEFAGTWMIGVGISLSFVAGFVDRAPLWMQRAGLEWLHRLFQEPKRLGRRYLVHDLPFVLKLLMDALTHRYLNAGRSTPERVPMDLDQAASARQLAPSRSSEMTMPVNAVDDIRTFDSWATDYYEPLALRYYDSAIARMLDLLAVGKGGLILDAGCGTGVHSVRAAKAGYRIEAVDMSEVVLDVAREHARVAGVADQIRLSKANLTRLDFPSGHFDAIFSWGVIIHIPEIEAALAELCRVLKAGGRVALQITNLRSIDYSLERLARSVLRKPDTSLSWSRFGAGSWCEMNGGRLFNWHLDIPAVSRYLESELPLCRTYRGAAEFTELHRRFSRRSIRNAFRQINRFYFSAGLPASIANTNLLVFEKRS